MPGLGFKTYLQLAPEGTYGTYQAPTLMHGQRLEVISYNVNPVIGTIPDPSLYNASSRRALFQGGLAYRGTIVVRCGYEGMLEILRGVSGTYVGAAVGADTYAKDHVFTEGGTLKSFTIEVCHGDVPTGKVIRLLGAKLTGVTIRGTAGQGADAMLQCELNVLAKDYDSNSTTGQTPAAITGTLACTTTNTSVTVTTAVTGGYGVAGVRAGSAVSGTGIAANTIVASVDSNTSLTLSKAATASGTPTLTFTATAPSLYPVLFHQMTTVDNGVVTSGLRVRTFELALENPHTEDRWYFGSTTIDEPLRGDFITARWRFTQEFADLQEYVKARSWPAAGSELTPKVVFTGPGTIGSTSVNRELELRSQKAQITEFGAPIEGYGIVLATIGLEAFYDAGDTSALYMRVRSLEPVLT